MRRHLPQHRQNARGRHHRQAHRNNRRWYPPATAIAPKSRHALECRTINCLDHALQCRPPSSRSSTQPAVGASSTSRTPRSPACSAIARSIEALRPHASSIGSFKNAQPLRDHDLLGSKFRRDIHNVLKVRACGHALHSHAPRYSTVLGLFCSGQSPNLKPPYRCDSSRTCSSESYPWQSTYRCIAPVQSSQHVARGRCRRKEFLKVKITMADIHDGKLRILHLVHFRQKGAAAVKCARRPLHYSSL